MRAGAGGAGGIVLAAGWAAHGEPVEIERGGGAVATHVAVRHDAVLAEREGAVLLQVLVEVEHGVEVAPACERPRHRRPRPRLTAATEPPVRPCAAQ